MKKIIFLFFTCLLACSSTQAAVRTLMVVNNSGQPVKIGYGQDEQTKDKAKIVRNEGFMNIGIPESADFFGDN